MNNKRQISCQIIINILKCRITNNGCKSTLYNAKRNASYEESSRDTIQMIP